MENQIPAYIMVPSDGETVFCWGVDVNDQPFSGVIGQRLNGKWQLTDPSIILGTVVSWRYPDSRTRHGVPIRQL